MQRSLTQALILTQGVGKSTQWIRVLTAPTEKHCRAHLQPSIGGKWGKPETAARLQVQQETLAQRNMQRGMERDARHPFLSGLYTSMRVCVPAHTRVRILHTYTTGTCPPTQKSNDKNQDE